MSRLPLLCLLACSAAGAAEPDLDTLERLALGDRAAAIASLPPGGAEQWYWRVVQAQLADPASAGPLIESAAAEVGDEALIRRLRLRQAALMWGRDPDAPRWLADELGATMAAPPDPVHARAGAAPAVPRLDVLRDDLDAGRYDEDALAELIAGARDGRLHALLGGIASPAMPGLVAALARDLDGRRHGFGSLPVHRMLTAEQLAALVVAVPRLAADAEVQRLRLRHCAGAHAQARRHRDPAAWRSFAEALRSAADHALLAWAAAAAEDELLLLDMAAGGAGAARLRSWRAAHAAAGAAEGAIPLAEVRTLCGLPERDLAGCAELATDRLLAMSDEPPEWASGIAGLASRHAEARVLAGRLEPARAMSLLGGPAQAQALRDRRELALWPGQETALAAGTPVSIRLVAKRIGRLELRLWRLDEEAVLRAGGRIAPDIDLSGIAPTAVAEVPVRDDPWLRQELAVPLPQVDAPGAWVIEAMGGDQAVRLLLRRGAIELMAGADDQGNRAVVVDESGQVMAGARIWIGSLRLDAGPDGVVRLPDGGGGTERLVAAAGGRACVADLALPAEAYRLRTRILAAREHLLAGTTATIVVGAGLVDGGSRPLPSSRLHRPELALRWSGRDGRPLGLKRQALELAADRDALVAAAVPEGAVRLDWRLEGLVRHRATGRDEPVADEGGMAVSPGLAADALAAPVLRRAADGWELALVGRAGEPLSGAAVSLAVQVRGCGIVNPAVGLAAGEDGRLRLGGQPDAAGFVAAVPGSGPTSWTTELDPPELPADSLCAAGETLALPRARAPRAFLVDGGTHVAEAPEALRRVGSGWQLQAGAPGDYRIHDGGRTCLVRVRACSRMGGFRVGPGIVAEAPAPAAGITAAVTPAGLELAVAGFAAGVRVHLLPLRLWPAEGDVELPRVPECEAVVHDWLPPEGGDGRRTVGAEEWYTRNRRDPHLAGVMLDRPGPLLDPWDPAGDLPAMSATGGRGAVYGSRAGGGRRQAVGAGGGSRACEPVAGSLVPDWLAAPMPIVDHLRPDGQGRISVPIARLGDAHVVVVVASDGVRVATVHAVLPPRPLPLRERRLAAPFARDAMMGVTSGLAAMQAGQRLVVPPSGGSQIRLIDSVSAFIDLLRAGWPEADLGPFARLGSWPALDAAARRRLWDEGASHELHLFLLRHDPDFAARVLTPYRRQMMVPDAALAALCGLDPAPWLAAGAELNPVERILLAERLEGARAAPLRRQVRDAAAQAVPDPGRRTAIVEALLAGAGPTIAEAEQPPARIGELQQLAEPSVEVDPPMLRDGLGDPRTWIESRWWRCQGRPAIADGPLWAAYADRDAGRPFLPVAGLELLGDGAELRSALALADLPFVPAAHRWEDGPDGRVLVAGGPLIVAQRLVMPLPRGEGAVSLYRRTCILAAWKADRPAAPSLAGSVAAGEACVDELVAVNLGPVPVEAALLAQVPAGAVALGGDPATLVEQVRLDGYASRTVALRWYLPRPGDAVQAAATATVGGRVVASVPARTWTTAGAPPPRPWTASADPAALFAGLAVEPLDHADLGPVARRCADPGFYRQAVAVLRARGAWVPVVWGWSLRHGDAAAAGEWLARDPAFAAAAGPWLRCPLVAVDRLASGSLGLVEVSPLVNPRRHRAGPDGHGAAAPVAAAWRELLGYLAHKPAPDDRDRLAVAGLLLAQDRVEDALQVFAAIDPAAIQARIQYDWCAAWLAMARGDLAEARRLAANHRDAPAEHWFRRWSELASQLAEIDGRASGRASGDPAARLQAQADGECSLALERDPAGGVVLAAHAAPEVELRLRPLDAEAIFARAPFSALDGDARRLCTVAPQAVIRLAVPGGSGRQAVVLPEAWRNRCAVLEAAAGGASAAVVVLASDLDVRVAAASGLLIVTKRSTGAPVAGAYVKVMRSAGGDPAFHKDGYTDRRGRFDHFAVNGALPRGASFAILVTAEGLGAAVVQADGPR